MKAPFRQVPIYDSNQTFEINAEELNALIKIAETYSNFIPTFEAMISKFIDEGRMTIKYLDANGKELTKKQIEKILKESINQINSKNIEPEL